MKKIGLKRGLALLLLLGIAVLALTGCVAGPTITDTSATGIRLVQPTGAFSATTTVEQYGVFYSKSRQAVVDVDASKTADVHQAAAIVNPEGATQITTYDSNTYNTGQATTITVDVGALTQGEMYYFRAYAIGHTNPGNVQYRVLYAVAGHATSSSDAYLKKIKASKGSLKPSFSKTKYSYTDTLAKGTSSTKITVTPDKSGSTVQLMVGIGSWSTATSKTISVSKGKSKTLWVKVTASNGTSKKTYKIVVKRKS